MSGNVSERQADPGAVWPCIIHDWHKLESKKQEEEKVCLIFFFILIIEVCIWNCFRGSVYVYLFLVKLFAINVHVFVCFFPSSFFWKRKLSHFSGLIIAFQLGAVLKEFQLSSFWCEDLLEGFSHSNTLRSRDQNLWTGGALLTFITKVACLPFV